MKPTGYNSVNSWIATFACTVICFVGLIPMRLSGLFFVAILDQFHISRELATIPIVLFGSIKTLGGPVTGFLGEVFGLEVIIFIGSILMALGVGCCCIAKDAIEIIIYLGLIYGIGYAFTNTLVPSVIKQNFNNNVNLANGVCLFGSCLGAAIFSPVIQYLIQHYGTSGMFLILSGILLHAVPAAMILKDPKNEFQTSNNIGENSAIPLQNDNFEKVGLSKEMNYAASLYELEDKKKVLYDSTIQNTGTLIPPENSQGDNDSFVDHKLYIDCVQDVADINKVMECAQKINLNEKVILSNLPTSKEIKNKLYCQKVMHSNHPTSIERERKTCCRNFQLFFDLTFLLQMCLQSIHVFIVVLNWTVILDFGRDKGIATEWGLYFIVFLSISEMLGNLSLNWITDSGYMSRTNFCVICLVVKAVVSGLILWANSYVWVMVGLSIFGFFTGVVWSTFPGLIMEFIDKDKQNMALASRFTLYGVFGLAKSSFIGYCREILGSYDGIYYFIMFTCIFCAILCILTPILASRQRKGKANLNPCQT